jgi:hypothetical protein
MPKENDKKLSLPVQVKKSISKKVRPITETRSESFNGSLKVRQSVKTGLPDFSWHNIPNRKKYTK